MDVVVIFVKIHFYCLVLVNYNNNKANTFPLQRDQTIPLSFLGDASTFKLYRL